MKKIVDSQLDSDIWGVLIGVVFGGILGAAVAKGIDFLMVFNLFFQPIQETSAAFIVAVGIVVSILIATYSANEVSLILKTRLMKQYLEAREIIRKRSKDGNS